MNSVAMNVSDPSTQAVVCPFKHVYNAVAGQTSQGHLRHENRKHCSRHTEKLVEQRDQDQHGRVVHEQAGVALTRINSVLSAAFKDHCTRFLQRNTATSYLEQNGCYSKADQSQRSWVSCVCGWAGRGIDPVIPLVYIVPVGLSVDLPAVENKFS